MTAEGCEVFECVACGAVEFPRRLLCPRCGAPESRAIIARQGLVEETTVVRHRAGGEASSNLLHLATILTDAGPRVIARLDAPLASGSRAILRVDAHGAVAAAPLSAPACAS